MNTESLLSELQDLFPVCHPLDGDKDAVRCERKYKDQTRAVYFFRGSSTVPDADEIRKINEEILSHSYFRSSDASRWSHYFVIVTDDDVTDEKAFYKAKKVLENDKNYARKFVVKQSELPAFIGTAFGESVEEGPSQSIINEWLTRLNGAGLSAISTDQQRSPAIRDLRFGTASQEAQTATDLAQISRLAAQAPAPQMLTSLTVNRFGSRRLSGTFPFRRVNLILGPNGAGKTSLLESIEHFFCGATYRSGGKADDLVATASFPMGTPDPYSPLTNAEAQTRDQHWYGHTVVRGNKLCQGFARFNFLNTDAAVDFSRDNELQDLTDSLSKIALGPETTYMWNRIGAFEKDISAQLTGLENDLAMLNGNVETSTSRLAALQTASPQIEAMSFQVQECLSALAWPDPGVPEVPDSDWFSRFNRIRGLINASESITSVASMSDLAIAIDDLSSSLRSTSLLEAEVRSESLVARDIGARRAKLATIRKLSERHIHYLDAMFIETASEEHQLRNEQTALAASLVRTDDLADLAEVAATLGGTHRLLKDIVQAIERDLARARDEISEVEQKRTELDRQLTVSKSVVAQIRALGRSYAKSSPEADHCPLCLSQMAMAELISRLDSELGHDARASELETLAMSRSDLEHRIRLLSDSLTTAMASGEALGDRSSLTVDEALGLHRQAHEKWQSVSAQAKQVQLRVATLEEAGFSQGEYARIVSAIDDWLEEEPDAAPSDVPMADLVSARLLAAESSLGDQEQGLRRRADERAHKEQAILGRHGAPDMEALRNHLQQRLAELNTFQDRFESLPSATKSKFADDIGSLISAAREASGRIDDLSSQIQGERARSAEISVLHQQIAVDKQQVLTKDEERKRLADALDVLHDIQSNHSLDSGLSSFMLGNLESIQRIFTKIHAPHELKISDLTGCRLERLGSDHVVELNQISTGQRAALMLSIFISLNLSLKSGPPYMLIDDPIAHIDDLNVLSFLDLLADVAETGHRQIFFATANEKLAHLFQKKMEFLGTDFQTLDLTDHQDGQIPAESSAIHH